MSLEKENVFENGKVRQILTSKGIAITGGKHLETILGERYWDLINYNWEEVEEIYGEEKGRAVRELQERLMMDMDSTDQLNDQARM